MDSISFEKYISDNNLGDAKSEGKICCPVHDERTPSLSYSDSRQTFSCFGCGIKGSVLELHWNIKKKEDERFSTVKAIYDLGRIYHLDLPDLFEMSVDKTANDFYSKSTRKRGTERNADFYLIKLEKLEGTYKDLPLKERFQISHLIDMVLLGAKEPKESYKKINKLIQAHNRKIIMEELERG